MSGIAGQRAVSRFGPSVHTQYKTSSIQDEIGQHKPRLHRDWY